MFAADFPPGVTLLQLVSSFMILSVIEMLMFAPFALPPQNVWPYA